MRTIDIQAHYFPRAYLNLLEGLGKTDVPESRKQTAATESKSDIEFRLAQMDNAGVDMQILSVAGQMPYFPIEVDASLAARTANSLFAALTREHPGRFSALGVVPLPHVDASLNEVNRIFDELNMAGITLGTSVLGRSICDSAFEELYAELDRREAVVYIHPSGLGAHSPLISPFKLSWMMGAPIEDTVAAVHLITSGIVRRYPRVKFIIAHLGGALPVMLERLDFLYAAEHPDLDELPSVSARRMWYDTCAHGDIPALSCAIKQLGETQMVFGSDYPYQLDDAYQYAVAFHNEIGLPSTSVTNVLGGSVEKLFGDRIPSA